MSDEIRVDVTDASTARADGSQNPTDKNLAESPNPTDRILPDGKWAFDSDVTDVFEDMLRRSIPQYEVMRDSVTSLAARHVKAGLDVLDLGCSRGDALAPLIDKFGAYAHFRGLEVSEPMLSAARLRFKGMIDAGVVSIEKHDFAHEGLPPCRASVILSVLSLMFTPINYRMRILSEAYARLEYGGCFILVEKVLGADAPLDSIFIREYHALKAQNGYTQEQITRKALSLEGVLVPVSAQYNESLLRGAGFTKLDCFWRWMNFAGWIAIK